MATTPESTDVIICGAGPTGAMLSALLARAGVPNVCLDKEPVITTDPRGIALDEDGIRALQSIGIYDAILSEIGSCMGIFNFIGGRDRDLYGKPFLRFDYTTTEGGTGHVGFICHKQPVLEKHIRSAIAATSCGQLRTGYEITSITELDDCVEVSYKNGEGEKRIRGKFLVGADGKTGYTRKHYLELKGITMDQTSNTKYEEDWVALNWRISLPTPKTHPGFPLWELGYTPEHVYDLFFPVGFRFLCNPERPAVCGRFGLPRDRLWRFEFVVGPGEDAHRLCEAAELKRIVYPYISHDGSRYGVHGAVSFPEDCIETIRARPFHFAARSCNRWSHGRVAICGDAAHVFPPFGGQGITSGFRDAMGLAWRLELACRPGYTGYDDLLRGWYLERKDQLEKSLAATIENGKYVNEQRPLQIFLRDWSLWLYQLYPPWRRSLEQGARRFGMTRYAYTPGMAFHPECGGRLFPQVYCVPLVRSETQTHPTPQITFTDDVIFAPHKKGLFQLVLLFGSAADVPSLTELAGVDEWSKGLVSVRETTAIIEDLGATLAVDHSVDQKSSQLYPTVVRVACGDEFAKSPLCRNRPPPQYYDELRIGKEESGSNFLILRKDRFVFASCNKLAELETALVSLASTLDPGRC